MSRAATDLRVGAGLADARIERIDRFGVVASSLCAVHCAATALLPATFGILGLGWLRAHEAEWVFTLVAVAFAAGALTLAWGRHRSTWVAALLAVGIVGLLASRGLESGSAHHGHHGDPHHAHAEHGAMAENGTATPREKHGPEHAEGAHGSAAVLGEDFPADFHQVGTVVGVLAGLVLLAGHFLNIRMTRRCLGAGA